MSTVIIIGLVLAMAPRKLSSKLTVLVSIGIYMFCTVASYVMKRKPRPIDGTVMIDLDKNRLVESSLSGSDPPDDGLTRIQ